ncbi:MAG: signal peptidase [Nocardioides sp.]|nr:signal peptidase [Nocardioides sp.]
MAGSDGHRTRSAAQIVTETVSWALLVGALALGVACVLLPMALGAVPLTILSGSMAPGMPPGSLAIVRPVDATQARIGDVLTYQPQPDDPTLVTHRVVAVSRNAHGDVSLTVQGDANRAPDEQPVRPDQVQGSVVYAVPYVGRVANRLNVGGGGDRARWAGYALIGVGALRILLGLCAHLRPARTRCSYSRRTTIAPSPTADATRFTEPLRTSPTANTPALAVSGEGAHS